MRRFTFLFFLTLLSSLMWTSVNAQQYCAAAGSDTQVENITNVTFAGINNTTTTHLGYNDFTGLVAQVAQGEQQQLSVTINAFIGGGDFVYAFIDWNGNGILNDVGEVYTLATNTFSSWSYTLNVTAPNDAVSGNIRMRIIIAYDKINPDPCGNFDFGEVEDYTISITPPLAACPTGDFTFTTQAEIDAFGATYGHCTEIPGNVLIQGGDITNLDGLSALTSIGGFLLIQSNSQLTNLDGLSNLTQIGGYLRIYINSQLTNLDGLSNLTQIGGYLGIQSNSQLTNLDGLSNLTQIGGYLDIYNNSQLTNLDGLSNLTQIGGYLQIVNISQLTNLDGLSALESINGDLVIYNNAVLTDISGLQNIDPATILSTYGLGLYIVDNPLLSVCDLDNFCTYLAGSGPRTISGNAGDCVSVTAVTTACTTSQEPQCPTGDVILTSQTQVNDFGTNYPNCTEITGNLYIGGSDITDLSPLSNIQSIGGYLNIQSNSQLTNLDGLSALESINGDLVIYNNPVLTDISGLQNIDPATILPTYSSGLYIQNNPLLSVCNLDNFCTYLAGSGPRTISGNAGDCVSVTAVTTACTTSQEPQCPTGDVYLASQTQVNDFGTNYPNCTEITGYLYIGGSTITDLSPLSNIIAVTGNLYAEHTSQLTSLQGLHNVASVGGSLSIYNNPQLNSVQALSNITSLGGFLSIYNTNLSSLEGLHNITAIDGGLSITSNAVLTDISALENIDPETITDTGLYIAGNSSLSVCNLSNFCAYLAGDGERTISGNLGTCYDVDAVVAACNASVYDCPDLELNIGDTCTDADGNEGTVDEDCNCYVEPTPAVCEWTVHIWDNHWGDDVTWSLTDQEGNVLLQGGYYDLIYDDTQTVTTEGPLTFTISNVGEHNDNIPNYTVSNGTEILVEGQLTQPSMTLEFIDLNCSEVTPPIYDCPDLEANFGDVCTNADGNEGTIDEDCNCYVEPTPPVGNTCEWTVHIWDYSWGDEVTWSLKDKDGNVLLQGSYDGYDYDDTQTVTTEGPLKFTISNVGNHGDNMPNYTVSNGTEILVEGQLTESPMTLEFTDLNCYVAPTCSAEWTGAVSEDWNTAANWCDNTVPTAGSNVVINNSNLAIIDINTVVTIESITLGAAANVTVNGLLNVGDITVAAGGSLVIANDANLLQSETATNTGNITVKRNTVIKHLDYTIWSSPVADQELEAFSPNTLASRIYQYNTSTDAWEVTAENFTAGKGIMFRAPNLFDDGNYPNAYTYEGVFTGTPHNGDISVSFSQVGEYQGVGNPYPSNIKITGADGFWNTNPTVGTLYFWTNTNAWDTGTGDYVANNWATYSNLGGLAAANSTKVPVDIISVGQGFVIKTPGLSSISFNNGMRIAQNSVFFRTIEEDKHRLWLNLSDSSSELNNILIGYMDGATQGEDLRIDSKMFNYNGSALYSLIESNGFAYTIQGRSLPFDDFDVVPLGFRATTSGAFTVSLSNFDGVFAQGQDIFLKDNLTQTQHNLKDSDYTFVSNQGEFTTRFEVVYRTSMDVTNPELSNAWAVYVKDKTFFIETQGIDLKEVMVYDMLGRVIYESQAQGNKHSFAQIGANQVLVIKVITTDNKVLTKKVSN